jgi:hypothetical protein
MDKMQLAHEWAKELLRSGDTSDDVTSCAWRYADAMYAEFEKRQDKSRPEVLMGELKEAIVKNGWSYYDRVNFNFFKFEDDQWFMLSSPSQDKWVKCNEPNLFFLIGGPHDLHSIACQDY